MFNNIPTDETLPPIAGENDVEVGMQDVDINRYNRLETPIVLEPQTATFEDVALHALLRQRLSLGTINRNLRYARYMEKHPCPIDFRNFNYENVIRHFDYREQIEKAGYGALKHEWQAIRMFIKAYGLDIHKWHYRPPKQAKYTIRPIPYPKQVHDMIHLNYSKDPYTNALIKTLITHNHVIGWRPPSEPSVIKASDVDLDNASIKVTSPKLNNATRYLDISEIATRNNIYSMKNWLKWRSKVENQYSDDYLYLKPSGLPFKDKEHLRMFLNRKAYNKIKTVFPEYYNYTSRHFCAIARLIRAKLETKHYDVFEVKEWMGHTKIETTMAYVKDAKFYFKKHPYDWIKRVLKFHDHGEEENTLKIEYAKNPSVQSKITPVGLSRRLPHSKLSLEGIFKRTLAFFDYSIFQPISFFFSFFNKTAMGVGV